jgi:hypothetical protein
MLSPSGGVKKAFIFLGCGCRKKPKKAKFWRWPRRVQLTVIGGLHHRYTVEPREIC